MKRTRLGSWTCPSGNSVDVFLTGDGRLRQLALEWDRLPYRAADAVYYYAVILPEVAQRAREYLELLPGRTVVIR